MLTSYIVGLMLAPLARYSLQQLLPPDRGSSASAMALRAEPSAARKPARHAATAQAHRALVIGTFSGSWHLLEI